MPASDFKNIKALIWDLDNTLYRFEEGFEQLCHIAAAKAALKGGLDKSYEETLEICYRSYDDFGQSYYAFIKEYGMDHRQIHHDFHVFIDETILKKSIELIACFERLPLQHVILTHASREWATRVLTHLGLKKFFPDTMIIAAEEMDFAHKARSRIPFENALALLDQGPATTAVIEDVAAHLKIPHEMGLHTVLVHYGKPPIPLPDYIDYACNNALEFLEAL